MGEVTRQPIQTQQWKHLTFKEKMKFFYKNITVEPILSCYVVPSVIAKLATSNLNLEKACRVNLNYTSEDCDKLAARHNANLSKEENEIQKLVAGMEIWKSATHSCLPVLIVLFLGAWSDQNRRRKPCMLLPIFGEFLTGVGLIMCTYYFLEWPMEIAGIVESVFPAITGGWTTMLMGTFSYMGDVTTVEMRTVRIGIVNMFVSAGIPIGTALSGILYKLIGFYGVFLTVTVLYLCGFIYGLLRIKEIVPPKPVSKHFFEDFFKYEHIVETFKVALKKRDGNKRFNIILVMILAKLLTGAVWGEFSIMYLFTRKKFNWNEVDYSIYSTYAVIIHLIGKLLVIGVLSNIYKVDDALIRLLGCGSRILTCVLFAFSSTSTVFYIATLADMISPTAMIAVRSMTTKLVASDELGKLNSLNGVCEAVVPIIYIPLYSMLYAHTIDSMPSAFFLLTSVLLVPEVFIFIYLYILHRKETAVIKEGTETTNMNSIEKVNIGFIEDNVCE